MDEEAGEHLPEIDDCDVESDGHSQVGSLSGTQWKGGASENTPLLHRQQSPTISVASPSGSKSFAMTFNRDNNESFAMTYNADLNPSRNASFSRNPYSRNTSFAFSDCSFKS